MVPVMPHIISMSAGDTHARSRFQNGLLTWLRAAAPQEHANGLREMIAVTRSLAEGNSSGQVNGSGDGLLWRSAGSFLQALLDGSLDTDEEARALCRRLERHLASKSTDQPRDKADALANAIFAFVSNSLPAAPNENDRQDSREFIEHHVEDRRSVGDTENGENSGERSINAADASLNALLSDAFSATADVLPLLGNAKPRRFNDKQLALWKSAIAQLRQDWHAVQVGKRTDCRAASIALLQLSIELADAPSLLLAEAFAEAGGAAEDPAVLALASFRAAFTAAIEVAEHVDGPDQKGFAESATTVAKRLSSATVAPKASDGMVCASAPWFAEDAREALEELAAALDAVPPKRLALLSGFDWFIQHESGKAMAIRGLAITAHKVIGQIRTDDLDESATHAIIGRTIEALQHAVSTLATGTPPHPEEAVFAELRALDRRISTQRQLAIAAANAIKDKLLSPDPGSPSLQ